MTHRRLRSLAILLTILALFVAACGPQESPTEEPTEVPPTAEAEDAEVEETEAAEADETEVAEEETEAAEVDETEVAEEETEAAEVDETEVAEEETEAAEVDETEVAEEETEAAEVEDGIAVAQVTEEATEEMAEMDVTEEATEEMAEMDATEEATEEMAEMDATEEATEEMAEMDATEEATEEMAEMDATEEATEEMAEMDATEEATEEMDGGGMMEVEMATFEDGPYTFNYPARFEVEPSLTTDLVRLTSDEQVIVVVGPESYGVVLGGVEFEADADRLAFYLDRSGYTVGEGSEMAMGIASFDIAFPRRNRVGVATLIDLDNGRRGVVIELGPDADNVPNAEGAVIMNSIVYPADLVDVAVNAGDFTTLVTAVQTAGLEDTLRDGEFTVFAPTDEAFAALLEALDVTAEDLLAREDLADILTYHVVEGIVLAEDVVALDGETVTTVNGATLTIGVTDDGVTLTDGMGNVVNVVMTDIEASNGVIHVIDAVLLPPAPEPEATPEATEEMAEMDATEEATEEMAEMDATEEATEEMGDMDATEEATEEMGDMDATEEATEEMAEMDTTEEATEEMGDMDATEEAEEVMSNTIVDAAVATDELSSLAAAVVAAELVETLSGEGPFTVFAPTNAAFEAALEALEMDFDDLRENPELLTSILTYHVVEGVVLSTDLEEGDVETLNGATITVSFGEEGEVMINGAMVITADVEVDNGVVHIIDAVLVPPADEAAEDGMDATEEATEAAGD